MPIDRKELGRLGGLARAKTCDMKALGRRGGQATAQTHDHDHYVAIGQKGFRKLAQKYASRRQALNVLSRKGKVTLRRPRPTPITPEGMKELAAMCGMPDYCDNFPF